MTRSLPFFDLGRSEKFPTQYKDQHTPASIDVTTTTLIILLAIVTISFFCILPAYGKKKRRSLLLRIVVSLFTGGVILVGNYGHNWEIGEALVTTPYKPSSHEEITGVLGLHITIRGINVTLTGKPVKHGHNKSEKPSELDHERINYNENFSWEWAQGRFGFGYYAGQISKDFRAASLRGVPLPILQVAEYFTFDGEGIRFGRYYRLAGWYCHILMWIAFATWLMSNILFCMIVSSALYFLIGTGFLQLAAILVWTYLRNPIEIQIPFQSGEDSGKDVILKTKFGLDYYMVLGNGIFCVVLGLILMVLNILIPDEMCTFFGIDPLTIYDELVLSKDELEKAKKSEKDGEEKEFVELGTISTNPEACFGESGDSSGVGSSKKVSFYGDRTGTESDSEGTLVLKRRTNVGSTLFRKSFKVKPKPKPRAGKQSYRDEDSSQTPFLQQDRSERYPSSDEESHFSWPLPPRESFLRKPPSPPPKPRFH